METFIDCSSGYRTEGEELRIADYLGSQTDKPGNSMLQNANLDSKLVADIPIAAQIKYLLL